MNLLENFNTSFASLKRNKVRSFLTMLGIIIGVASVVLLISLGSGLQQAIAKEFERLGTNTIYVMPGKFGEGGGFAGGSGMSTNKLKFSDADEIKKNVENVLETLAGIESITSVEFNGEKRQGVIFLGTGAGLSKIGEYKIKNGRFFTDIEDRNAKRVAIIGQTIVEKMMGGINPIGKQISIKGKKYKVIGVLEKLGSLVGQDRDNIVILPIGASKQQLGFDRPTWILVKTTSTDSIPKVKREVKKLLLKRLSNDDFSVLTSEETLQVVGIILGIVSTVLAGIAAISLIVGGIGISNIMLVSVTERTREIGLRKAVGAKPQDILTQFLIEAVVLSLTGGFIGLAIAGIGTFFANLFLPATITWPAVILAFGFSVIIGVVFGVAPAIRAARLNPIDALRYE